MSQPTEDLDFMMGRGGVKRTYSGENFMDRPTKIRKTSNFDILSEGGSGAENNTHIVNQAKIHTRLKNATPPASCIENSDQDIIFNCTDACNWGTGGGVKGKVKTF